MALILTHIPHDSCSADVLHIRYLLQASSGVQVVMRYVGTTPNA